MNIVQLQDQLKNFSQDQLIREMQMPSGTAPQFLVLGEIMRRQKMQKDFAAQQAKGEPQGTVAEEAIAASGVPQGGIADMARAMAPKTDMAQSTGVQAMATGGPVKKMAEGDRVVIGGVVYIEQADGSLRSASGAAPPAATAESPEAPRTFYQPPPAPDRGGVTGTNAERDLGPFRLPETLQTEVRIGPDGSITMVPPVKEPTDRADRDQQGAAAIPTAQELAAEAAAAQDQPTSPGGGGAGGGAGGMSSFEQELMDAIARREKAAEQDKWLALAQVGLNLMSSTNATPLGALGEAGIAGVEAARTARDQYDKDRMDLMTALEQSRQSRAAAAAAAAERGRTPRLPEGALDVYDADLEAINTALSDTLNPPTPDAALRLTQQRNAILLEKERLRRAYLAPYGIESSGASPAASSGIVYEDVPS